MSLRLASLMLLLLSIPLSAQGRGMPDGSKARQALAPLAHLVGKWEGDARVVTGPGQQIIVRQHEDVVFGAGSTVLMIRGTGLSTDAAARGDTLFEAAAMIWFDAEANRLRMRAHRAEGTGTDADIEVRSDSIVWGFTVPGGRVRYTIDFPDGEWHEVGHFLRDSAPSVQMIEMRLKRAAN